MHWIDDASLSADGQTAVATRRISPDHPFVQDGTLLPSALIELMAQAAAAGSGLSAQRKNRAVRRGVLVAVQEFHALGPVAAGALLTLTSVHERTFGPLTKARLEARVNAVVVARAAMTFHLQFE